MDTKRIPGPIAQKILERDRQVVSPSYPRVADFVMDHALGSEMWDVDGNRFIDFAAGIGVCNTGHSHPAVVEAITRQAGRFLHISSDFYHPLWVEFSERLAAIAPFKEKAKVFLCNSGTEAVEAAIKLARYHTGRQQFIGFFGAFHGRTMGSLSFTASKTKYRKGFHPYLNGVHHVPYPNPYRPLLSHDGQDEGLAVVEYIENYLFAHTLPAESCAAIMIEPIQGEGGYIVPPPSFFPALRKLCDKHGILLIVDEVQSGIGRTGKWWAIEHFGVEPDIVCTAKGIASGVPLGGIIARESVMDWPQGAHGNTYGGNPLACAAGLATLDLIEDGMLENAEKLGEYAQDALVEMRGRFSVIGEVRGRGLMLGVEIITDQQSRKPAPELVERIIQTALQKGLVLMGCGKSTLRLIPPLNISRELLDEGLRLLEDSIHTAIAEG